MAALEKRAPSFSRISTANNCQNALALNSTSPQSDEPPTENLSENLKPLNIFYIWYYELCRRQNTHPLPAITHGSTWNNNQILDFTADRVKLEDWQPIINALRLDMSLHVICIHSRLQGQKVLDFADTEEKVKKIKKWFGTICTKYILKNLLKAISCSLKITQVLTCLEIDGLQIQGEYLTSIIKALASNKSVKYLSFKCCPIQDEGCHEICEALHQMPNVEILNLSNCGLGIKSGEYLGKVIKYQQINRYCESWHSSLRYEDPVVTNMAGLKRLTLNNNPALGDAGTELILQELVDDLWVKAIDMQRCGVTQKLGPKIIDVLQYSRSLKVVDFRKNQLSPATISRILEILREKNADNEVDNETEYQWCMTSTSLDVTSYGSYISLTNPACKQSRFSRFRTAGKPSTTTQKQPETSPNTQKVAKEKINTTIQKPDNSSLIKAKEQLMQLYEKLKEETVKREHAEKKCQELQKQVDELLTEQKNQMILKEFTNMKQYISKFISFVKDHGEFEEREPIILDLQNALDEVQILAKPYESPCDTPKQSIMFTTPVPSEVKLTSTDAETTDYTLADMKLQSMFQSMLGPSLPSLGSLDLDLNLETPVSKSQEPRPASPTESSDSDSVETLKRLLEELGNDDEEKSWFTEDVDTVSGPVSEPISEERQ